MPGLPLEAEPVLLEEPAVQQCPVLLHYHHSSTLRHHFLGPWRQKGETTRLVQRHGVHVCCYSNYRCAQLRISSASGVRRTNGVLPGKSSRHVLSFPICIWTGLNRAPLHVSPDCHIWGDSVRHDRVRMDGY
uniref:Uncharacterized protein n=1 Tax=Arundo donax TaxID=35708 RepID=A0A0A8YKC6_ARUDO